jgi:hypothetical protein
MKIEEFKKVLERHSDIKLIGRRLTRFHNSFTNWELTRVERLKEYTGTMDFNCQFKDGCCSQHRHREAANLRPDYGAEMCCCVSCGVRVGYLRLIDERHLKTYASNYNKETGFWRKDVGCTLPRKLRSRICVSFACNLADQLVRAALDAISSQITKYEEGIIKREEKLCHSLNVCGSQQK